MRETSAYYFLRTAKPNTVPQAPPTCRELRKPANKKEQTVKGLPAGLDLQLLQRMTGGQIHRAIS
ncbi:MAG: hypothetical protein ACLURG_12015 [Gemmiger sp.]